MNTQRNIPFGKPVTGIEEKEAILRVMDSGIMVHGAEIVRFESAFSEFTGAPFAVGVASCTAALHLTYFSLGIGRGDEVIVPAMTHVATAHAVELVEAKPVFVDAELVTGNIDIGKIESAITTQTRAISVVHYLGLPVDMFRICALAKKYSLHVIEDCALALGARYKGQHVGLFGTVGCFSFYPVKHITTGEGGMVITKDEKLAKKIILARAFGVDRHHGVRNVPGEYNVPTLGFNYRMSEIEAATGTEQLHRLPRFLEQRRCNFLTLRKSLMALPELKFFISDNNNSESSFYCLVLLLDRNLAPRRFDIMAKLKNVGIGTSIYYPHPVPRLEYYQQKYGYDADNYPNAAAIADTGIALPVGPHLEESDMKYIVGMLKKAIMEVKK